MSHSKAIFTFVFALIVSQNVQAEPTLYYDLTRPGGEQIQHKISISGRWLRLESSPRGSSDYILMDGGRLLMFEVNDRDKSYRMTRLGRLYWPSTPLTSPKFKPIAEKKAISGIRCQPVQELGPENREISRHCMSAGGPLGLNARETITLSRLFMTSRRTGQSWPAVATADERQVSIYSESPTGFKQTFKSVKHDKLDYRLFRIPRDYKRITPDLPIQDKRKSAKP